MFLFAYARPTLVFITALFVIVIQKDTLMTILKMTGDINLSRFKFLIILLFKISIL